MVKSAIEEVSIPHLDGTLAGIVSGPTRAEWLYVFGHGAGAGMRHPFMEKIAAGLAARGIASLRWEQPAMTAGKRMGDRPVVVEPMARSACAFARTLRPKARLVAGGKSMGGRMTSLAASKAPLDGVEGLVFLGFPLHPSGKPATERAVHLSAVGLPLLFVSGTRDLLAEIALLRAEVARLPRAQLVEIEGADHGLDLPKRAGIDSIAVACDAFATFIAGL